MEKNRQFAVKKLSQVICRIIVSLCGFLNIEYEYRTDIDYKEYLGPDWKAEWEGTGTYVGNHISFLDVMCMTWYTYPSMIARSTVR